MRYLSLFSGCGGMDLGCDAAGWECVWQVENDRHASNVLRRHWPDVAKSSDVCDFHGSTIAAEVVTFGAPCQGLSTAGLRKGLADHRSGLFFEATRIIKEMRDATGGALPRWAVYENVPGALSSAQGDDWAAVVDAMADCGAVDIQWRVLDSKFFGVPQRRRRVFLVACFDPRAAGGRPVLPVPEGVRRDPDPGVKEREITAGSLTTGFGRGGPDDNMAQAGHLIPFVKAHRAKSETDFETRRADEVAPTLNAFDQGDSRATAVFTGELGVRRLTPRECERLQGWPTDHTAFGGDGKKIPDTARYKLCGNGVTAPVMEWVARQINMREEEWNALLQTDHRPGAVPG